jgi:hypothetical protein
MRTERSILEEYRKGDLCLRLNMCLEHRDLRPRFAQIESDERALPKATVSGRKGPRIAFAIGSIWNAIVRRCCPARVSSPSP